MLTAGNAYGDIVVSGAANINTGDLTLTFSGSNVAGPVTVTQADVDGAGGAWGGVSKTTRGQHARPALGLLLNYGIISGTPREQDAGAVQAGYTKGTNTNPAMPKHIQKALMKEAAFEDANSGSYFSLEAVTASGDKVPAVETRTTTEADVQEFGNK